MLTLRPRADVVALSAAVVLTLLVPLVAADTQNCLDVGNDVQYKTDEIEGTWYPIEIVLHRNDSKIYGVPLDTHCPAVTFSVNPKNKRLIVMLWNSSEGDLEYKFSLKGRNQNQWQASHEQKGPGQEQFQGLKASILAVDKERFMLIRLCSTSIHNSVILSRQNTRSADVLNMANSQLEQMIKHPMYEKKAMCSAAGRLSATILTSVFVLMLLLRI